MIIEKLMSLVGLSAFVLIAWLASENRAKISYRVVLWGLGLQFAFAVLILKTGPGMLFFDAARVVMTKILDFTVFGARFLFGSLVNDFNIGAVVAFKVLPTIIFVSSLMAVLYYFGIIQRVVGWMGFLMQKSMGISGAEALLAAASVFMGIEMVTGVKEYIRQMTRSELFTLMTCFMATIAGSVMAAYVSFGASAGHLLAASVMSAPAAVLVSKLMVPETLAPATSGTLFSAALKSSDVNVIEAAANGASDGLRLAATIGAMLLAFVALIGMMDYMLGLAGTSFEEITGYVLSPVAFLLGVPWGESVEVGKLLGIKTIFNEFLSYQRLAIHIADGTLSQRSIVISTYALCSFANFGSIAIMIGGIGTVAPERKKEVAGLSLKALLAGTLASFMTAAIAGILA
jgi:CNT family concentrative nucleoside transporter